MSSWTAFSPGVASFELCCRATESKENVCSRKVRSIMHVLEKDHPGPGVRDGARIGGATKKEIASRAQRWRRMDGFEDTTVALASSWASLG